jgi:site-specific DNA recombinase
MHWLEPQPMASAPKLVRCAIYTRKSSEEGLEQEFNSLDAQREACEAYIKSQKHESWHALPDHYDDGGYSGGTLERTALNDLLTHIKQKKIDVVVVYKIDRLTRSLFDFSKIVEIFDAGSVSFVSITQQFNTTTSMGRLTLNVLLSFAQFEREVTSERIRDKIAASKKKGMWMGGVVPLGYHVEKRELVIEKSEAQMVRLIYNLYISLKYLKAVRDKAAALELRTRPSASGHASPLSRGHIYRILTNPIYAGKISHKGQLSQGLHQPIIEAEMWMKVQQLLMSNSPRDRDQPKMGEPSLLAGIIFNHKGERLTPSHAVKSGRRYRYYISRSLVMDKAKPDGIRLSAPEVENAVAAAITDLLADPAKVEKLLGSSTLTPSEVAQLLTNSKTFATSLQRKSAADQLMILRPTLSKVMIGAVNLNIDIKLQQLFELLFKRDMTAAPNAIAVRSLPEQCIVLPMRLGRRGNETRLIVQSGTQQRPIDQKLINLIARGYVWRQELVSGAAESASSIGDRESISRPYVSRLIDLSFLAPDIVAAVTNGTAPPDLSSEKLQSIEALPLDWASQRAVLGFGR